MLTGGFGPDVGSPAGHTAAVAAVAAIAVILTNFLADVLDPLLTFITMA